MFENKEISIEKVKRILYAVKNEFENDIDSIDDCFDKTLTDEQIDFAFEFLNSYIDKVEMVLDDELVNVEMEIK